MSDTDGDWVVLLHSEGRCCPEGLLDTDTILVSTQITQPGTLRSLLYATFTKGDSLLRGATAYVVRINKEGELRMARPCEDCWAAMAAAGIRKVVYSKDDGRLESEYIE